MGLIFGFSEPPRRDCGGLFPDFFKPSPAAGCMGLFRGFFADPRARLLPLMRHSGFVTRS